MRIYKKFEWIVARHESNGPRPVNRVYVSWDLADYELSSSLVSCTQPPLLEWQLVPLSNLIESLTNLRRPW